ncbi:MAG: GNAT family N-acetyltransferase [Chloroflexi bacterium]|nr:GNAT family N-acetyltransferase [Chloroflexota bacterium]
MKNSINDTDVVRLADLNQVQFWCDGANWVPGSEILLQRDLVLIDSALDFPGCNAAFNLSEDSAEKPEDFIAKIKSFFSGRKQAFSLILRGHADKPIIEYCNNKNEFLVAEQPGMVLDSPVKVASVPVGARLYWVKNAKEIRDFGQIVSEAYLDLAYPEECSKGYFAHPKRVMNPYTIMAVVHLDGEPVSTAMAMLSHGIAGIYWVGTLKKVRERGLAEYVVGEVCNKAFNMGARKVILQASKFGEPIYLKMGFREFTRYPWFICSSE